MWIDAADSGELATALIPAVWTFLGVVVVTLGGIFRQSMKARSERSSSGPSQSTSPPTNDGGAAAALLQVARDVARDIGQLDQRADDSDERDDLQDRELRDQRNVLDEHHRRLLRLERERGLLDE